MPERKIVSLEDRIPKLKEDRKKRANRTLIFYLSIFFILIALVLYLQSPLSNIKHIEVKGNVYVKNDNVKDLSQLSSQNNFWKINTSHVKKLIEAHIEIKSAIVEKSFPNTIQIDVNEYQRVGYVKSNGSFFPILETGKHLTSYKLKAPNGDAPLLLGWDKQTYLQEMTEELDELPASITRKISEIKWIPTEKNPYKIHLFMNDGYEVQASIRNFSKSMRAYPSIVMQLDSNQKGIIHLDVGAYFEAYSSNKEKKEGEIKNETNG